MDSTQHIIVWEGLDWKSIECLCWQAQDDGFLITSHLAGVIDETPFAIHYMIGTDRNWYTGHILISDLNDPDNIIELYTDKQGKWFDRDESVSTLEGCLDVDLSLTPFTNTLPMRRLTWEYGKRTLVDVAYIKLPEFSLQRAQQYYTRLSANTFLYENESGDFKASLAVDQNRLVTNYPGLAKRIFPA